MLTRERLEELDQEWDSSLAMDDDEYWYWYTGLTDEERLQIDEWDRQHTKAVNSLCKDILQKEGKQ